MLYYQHNFNDTNRAFSKEATLRSIRKLRKHLPKEQDVEKHRYLSVFGELLKQKELWAFNRFSVSKGVAIGLFCAFLPMPFEMVAAAFMCMMMRANLPLAFAGVWISNPFTWIPLYTPCYLLGSKIIGLTPIPLSEISILKLGWHYVALWLGCLIIGTILSLSSHYLINLIWRSQVKLEWAERRDKRRKRAKKRKT